MKIFWSIFFIFFVNTFSYSITSEELNRLTYKAKNDIAKINIKNFCSKEDPGLEIDSEIGDQIFFNSSCKCAIKSGQTDSKLVAKKILNLCGLN